MKSLKELCANVLVDAGKTADQDLASAPKELAAFVKDCEAAKGKEALKSNEAVDLEKNGKAILLYFQMKAEKWQKLQSETGVLLKHPPVSETDKKTVLEQIQKLKGKAAKAQAKYAEFDRKAQSAFESAKLKRFTKLKIPDDLQFKVNTYASNGESACLAVVQMCTKLEASLK
jgi:uncharacterized protein YdeI (YjbR/CyaY-like superfamily)